MKKEELLGLWGEALALLQTPIGAPMTAHELRMMDRWWRKKYLDSLVHAPCEHPDSRRIGERYCNDCGKNVGPYKPVETVT